jgi:thiamine phosphate synthase YjbQ (UPF0047 family)
MLEKVCKVMKRIKKTSHFADMSMALDKIVPESLNWLHTDEGPESVLFTSMAVHSHVTDLNSQ